MSVSGEYHEYYERKTNSEWLEILKKHIDEHFNEEGTRNLVDFHEVVQYAIAETLSDQELYGDAQDIKNNNPNNPYFKKIVYKDYNDE